MNAKNRTTSVELLRFLAATGVMMFHFGSIYLNSDAYNPSVYVFKTMLDAGLRQNRVYTPYAYVFVEFFFMTGGFLMLKYLDERKDPLRPGAYILHKIRSFYSIFILAFCAQFIFYIIINHIHGIAGFFDALIHFKWEALLLHCAGFLKDPSFNVDYLLGQDWYLSALVLALVVVYPLALYYRKFYDRLFAPWMTILLYAVLLQTYGTLNVGSEYLAFISVAIIRGVAGLCAGSLAYTIFCRLQEKSLTASGLRVLSVIDILLWLSIPVLLAPALFTSDEDILFYILIFGGIIVLGFWDKTPWSHFLNTHCTRLFSYLGGISLYLYLLHWTVMTAMSQYIPQLSPPLAIALFFGITFGLSALLKYFDLKRKSAAPVAVIAAGLLCIALAAAL